MDENKNIQEFEEEVVKELDEVVDETAHAPEVQEEVKSVIEQVKEALKGLKETVVNLDLDKDGVTLGARIEEFSKTVNETVNKASEKFNENPQAKETWEGAKTRFNGVTEKISNKAKELFGQVDKDKVQETVDEAAKKFDETVDKVVDASEEVYAKATENPEVKKVVDAVTEKTKEASTYVNEKYQEFIHDEKVRETVRNAKDGLTDLAGKAIGTFKNLFGGNNEEE